MMKIKIQLVDITMQETKYWFKRMLYPNQM